jgi:DNA-binding LytR/AlgR family response regulator
MNSLSLKWRCIIIDDEQHAIDTLTEYIAQVPNLALVQTYLHPLQAFTEIRALGKIDIIFMDVDMPGLTGLELAKLIRDKTNYLVFTTSHVKYALDAFEVQADQYLLKPFALGKFLLMMDKLMLAPRKKAEPAESIIYVRVEKKGKWVPVELNSISLIEAEANYIHIHTLTERLTVYLTMKEMEAGLARDPNFIRVHKSYIVSKTSIAGISGNVISQKDGSTITIGENYKENFLNYFNTLKIKSSR